MRLSKDFKEFIELLNHHEVEYMLVGGYAVGIYGHPRYTGDIDFWVSSTYDNAIKIIKVLNDFGFGSMNIKPEEFTQPNMVFQFGYEPQRIDLINILTGLNFQEVYPKRQIIEFEDIKLSVIDLVSLKINKKAIGRHKDLADLEDLT